jgi:hypothetical protein
MFGKCSEEHIADSVKKWESDILSQIGITEEKDLWNKEGKQFPLESLIGMKCFIEKITDKITNEVK